MNTLAYDPQDFRNQAVLAPLLQPEALSQNPALLADLIDPEPNIHQYAMAGFLFFQRHGKYPRKNHCKAAMELLRVFQRTLTPEVRKMRLGSEQIQGMVFAEEAKEGRAWEHVLAHKERQQPHEMGTVAEIAAKYNISKSEVRRLKAAGQLHTLSKEDA